jgi:uncharacterized alkaline shock family protein YloU
MSSDTPVPAYRDPAASIPLRPGLGDVSIEDDLIPTIVCYASLDTPGVVSITGRYTVAEVQSRRDAEKGIAVAKGEEGRLHVTLDINIEYGYDIYETTLRLQRSVKNAVEHMTGFAVTKVDVNVRGVVPQRTPPRGAGDDPAQSR